MPDDMPMNEWMANQMFADMEIARQRFQRREALAWLILSYDVEALAEGNTDGIVGTYGPFDSPEETLIQKVKHDAASIEGFVNVIVPLYPPVRWGDE